MCILHVKIQDFAINFNSVSISLRLLLDYCYIGWTKVIVLCIFHEYVHNRFKKKYKRSMKCSFRGKISPKRLGLIYFYSALVDLKKKFIKINKNNRIKY